MTLQQLLDTLPEYAKDLKLNMGGVMRQTDLTPQRAWGTAISCAIASRNPQLVESVIQEAAQHLTPEAIYSAKGAAAIMAMNNIFYRFRHLSTNPKYTTMPASLRMQIVARHGGDPIDFELWCVAVSAINGCGVCVDAHENVLRNKGVTEATILAAVRIASTIHAIAATLDTLVAAESPLIAP